MNLIEKPYSPEALPMSFVTYDEAFALIEKSWPGFVGSHFATGGFSGGSKGCWGAVAWLVKTRRDVVGIFMGGCNEDHSQQFRKQVSAPTAGYRKIRGFMSSGKSDNVATIDQGEAVKKTSEIMMQKTSALRFTTAVTRSSLPIS